MLLKTYEKIIDHFKQNNGYASFEELRTKRVTVTQIKELVDRGELERFAIGWYWCHTLGLKKPKDYKYVEIAKVNPNAVVCLTSAGYLHGLLQKEPEVISIATERTDRKTMDMDFEIDRHYFQNAGLRGEIQTIKTDFGSYQVYGKDRTMCDCVRMKPMLDKALFNELAVNYLQQNNDNGKQMMTFASRLHALKPVIDFLSGEEQ